MYIQKGNFRIGKRYYILPAFLFTFEILKDYNIIGIEIYFLNRSNYIEFYFKKVNESL